MNKQGRLIRETLVSSQLADHILEQKKSMQLRVTHHLSLVTNQFCF